MLVIGLWDLQPISNDRRHGTAMQYGGASIAPRNLGWVAATAENT